MLFLSQKPSSSYSLLNIALRHQSVSCAPPPKKNPGSAPDIHVVRRLKVVNLSMIKLEYLNREGD